jgi:hypothetical protein
MAWTLIKDARRRITGYNRFAEVFMAMLPAEAKASLDLSRNNLSDLYDCVGAMAAVMSKIENASVETEMALLSVKMVDRFSQFSAKRSDIVKQLARIEEELLDKIESENNEPEAVPEEEQIIELTEKDEVKPMAKRRWGHVAVAAPDKPYVKRRWGEERNNAA